MQGWLHPLPHSIAAFPSENPDQSRWGVGHPLCRQQPALSCPHTGQSTQDKIQPFASMIIRGEKEHHPLSHLHFLSQLLASGASCKRKGIGIDRRVNHFGIGAVVPRYFVSCFLRMGNDDARLTEYLVLVADCLPIEEASPTSLTGEMLDVRPSRNCHIHSGMHARNADCGPAGLAVPRGSCLEQKVVQLAKGRLVAQPYELRPLWKAARPPHAPIDHATWHAATIHTADQVCHIPFSAAPPVRWCGR
jgi:hypothetical protein